MIRYLFVLNNKKIFYFMDQLIYWSVEKSSIAWWNRCKMFSSIQLIKNAYRATYTVTYLLISLIIFFWWYLSLTLHVNRLISHFEWKTYVTPEMDGYKINANKNVICFSTNKMCKVYTLYTLVCHSHQGNTNIKDIRVAK